MLSSPSTKARLFSEVKATFPQPEAWPRSECSGRTGENNELCAKEGYGNKFREREASLQSAAWLTQATLDAVCLLGQGLMPKGTVWPGIECDKQEGFSPAWTLVKGFLRQDDRIKSPRV